MRKLWAVLFASSTLLAFSQPARAQFYQEGYDDYGNFASDPVDLDNETAELFGRFFQTNFALGTGIHTGDLGKAYAAGFLVDLKFIFFFDRSFAAELGVGYGQNKGFYNDANTKPTSGSIELSTTMNLVPLFLGLRYCFDQDSLTRGFSVMNPYVSFNGELVFRNEVVAGNPTVDGLDTALQATYSAGGIATSSALGVNFGGGFEFDVYKKKVYLGIDLRYHLLFWSNSSEFFGTLGRNGNYLSILGSASYNY